jgi:hypothetical protein
LIERIESRLAERDKIGMELQETLVKADKLFQVLFRIAGECRAAWPWQYQCLPAILLGDQSILHAVEHQLFKCGARPALGGGMDRPRPRASPAADVPG